MLPRSRAVVALLALVTGCGGDRSSPRAIEGSTVEIALVAQASAPPSAAPRPSSLPDDEKDPCRAAFEDQLSLYVDVEIAERGVHPDRVAMFLHHCRQMPTTFQRCASPSYQIDHGDECKPVVDESGTRAKQNWSAMFDVLRVDPDSLAEPLPR